jgi:hypothetical protein
MTTSTNGTRPLLLSEPHLAGRAFAVVVRALETYLATALVAPPVGPPPAAPGNGAAPSAALARKPAATHPWRAPSQHPEAKKARAYRERKRAAQEAAELARGGRWPRAPGGSAPDGE